MTAEQVRTVMGDPRPDDRIRFAQRQHGKSLVIEQWIYRGPPDIYVIFESVSGAESRVIAINTPPQK
jgi:hypothetical protein